MVPRKVMRRDLFHLPLLPALRLLVFALLCTLIPAAVAGPAFLVLGDPLSGNNETKGWGVTVQNDASGWLVIGSVALTNDPAPFLVTDFADLLSNWVANNSYAFAPNETKQLDWSAGTTGLAEFSFPSSPTGFIAPPLQLQINYDIFDVNPYDPNSNVGTDVQGSATATVSVTESDPPVITSTPEPGTAFLVLGALALAAVPVLYQKQSGKL